MEITGKTKVACLLGHPVSHSFSPYIQNYMAKKCDEDLKYVCFDVEEDRVSQAVDAIRALHIIGANVTIPHKVNVIPYLDELDKNAAIIGAVNTIKNENGKLIGYNTDGKGFIKSIRDAGHEIAGKRVMLLGAGGACRSIAVEFAAEGAASIEIRNHTQAKGEAIVKSISEHFPQVQSRYGTFEITQDELEGVDILVNTTPVGMSKDKESCPIDENIVPPHHLIVADIVYNPHETKLLKWAKQHELDVIYGIAMLINQGVEGFGIWTGHEVNAYEEIKTLLVHKGVISDH